MKISKIIIKNILGLEEFSHEGEGSMILQGKKGAGKTSVIDAIRAAISNNIKRDVIVRQGASEGQVYIELGNIAIDRKFRTSKADYKKITQDGNTVASPESFLREMFTELQLNPVEFLRYDDNEKNRIILNMIEFDWDLKWIEKQFGEIPQGVDYENHILTVLNDIQSDKGYYYQKRQDINRSAREKTAIVKEIGESLPFEYNGDHWREYSLDKVYEKVSEMIQNNKSIAEKNEALLRKETYRGKVVYERDTKIRNAQESEKEMIDQANAEIARAKRIIETQIEAIESYKQASKNRIQLIEEMAEKALKENKSEIDALKRDVALMEPFEEEAIQNARETAKHGEKMKSYINEYDRMVRLQDEVEMLNEKSESLTQKIEKARSLPGEVLKTAKIPIKGLTVVDGKPLIDGLPVNNKSDGELLELCIDITTQKPGNLNLILLNGLEQLDKKNRDVLLQKLKAKNIQFVATVTTDDEALTVIEI